MQTLARYFQRPHWRTYVFVAVLLALGLFAGTSPAHAADANCTLVGTTRTCDLWAKSGTIQLPDPEDPPGFITVPIWGYTDVPGGAAQLPGPTLIANEGETLKVILHNGQGAPTDLGQPTSLAFRGFPVQPDTVGVPAGGDNSLAPYTLTNLQPGTYMYEAGLTTNGPRQVATGMFGALIVRPAGHPEWAYDANSAFDAEAVLVLSEIDPAFNANPAGFNMTDYAPKYWLINGKAYPNTDPIPAGAGQKLLIRYLNAGLKFDSMGLLGTDQTIIADSGSPLAHPYGVVNETVSPGQTLDALVTIPAAAAIGMKYPLFNSAHVSNNGQSFGGMMTFMTIVDLDGPVTSNVVVSPNLVNSNAGASVTVTATASDASTGGSNIAAAEYTIDTGTAVAFSGVFGSPTVSVSATIPAADVANLTEGAHAISVRGQDAAGNWGAMATTTLNIDNTGPATSGLTAAPSPTNGSVDVTISAAISDASTGNSNVVAAEYTIDNGTAVAFTGVFGSPTVNISATIPAADVANLAEGAHTISVRGQDAAGNWGAPATATFTVDMQGPATSGLTVGFNTTTTGAVDITATVDDGLSGGSNAVAAEYRLDGGLATTAMTVAAGIPPSTATVSATTASLTAGLHTIEVRGQDAAGNWGAWALTTIAVPDTTGPEASATVAPDPADGTADVVITIAVNDTTTGGSNVVMAEYTLDGGTPVTLAVTPGTAPTGTATVTILALDVLTMTNGPHTVEVRGQDAAGNWGALSLPVTFTISH